MFMDISDKRAAFLRKERIVKNLTQQQFAQKINISTNAVSKWERGTCFPDTDHLIPIARIFDCTVEELLTGERTPSKNAVSADSDTAASTCLAPTSDAGSAEPNDNIPPSNALPPNTYALPKPSSGIRKSVRIALSASVLLVAVISFFALYYYLKPPTFEIIDSFYGDKDDTRYFDNAYCFIVECSGHWKMEDINAFSADLEEEYLSLYQEVDAIVIMFFRHYDPEVDYIDTADGIMNLLPPHQN